MTNRDLEPDAILDPAEKLELITYEKRKHVSLTYLFPHVNSFYRMNVEYYGPYTSTPSTLKSNCQLLLKHWTKAVDFRVTPSQPILLSFTWFLSSPCAMFRPHVIGKEVT